MVRDGLGSGGGRDVDRDSRGWRARERRSGGRRRSYAPLSVHPWGGRTDFIQAFRRNDPTLMGFQAGALIVHEKVHEKVDGKSE